jgi:endonuclease-8
VCFDAPVVELFEQRAEPVHAGLGGLGPDILEPGFEPDGPLVAISRLRASGSAGRPIAEAIVDQRCLAGIGNIYKSEALFVERVDPFVPVEALDDETLLAVIRSARRLMLANVPDRDAAGRTTRTPAAASRPAAGRRWVYGRGGRPCRRCGALIATRRHGELPRVTYWCPRCQGQDSSIVGRADGAAPEPTMREPAVAGRTAR